LATRIANNGAAGNFSVGTSWVGGVAPTAADDAQVGIGTTSITIDTGSVCRSLDFTGFAGTVSHTAGVTLTIGDATAGLAGVALKMASGMTYNLGDAATSAVSFVSTATEQQSITTATKTFGNITFNGAAGKWAFIDSLTTGAGATVTLTAGTLQMDGASDNSNLSHSIGLFASSNANARTLKLGNSTLTLKGVGTIFTFATQTLLSFDKGTSQIVISDVSASSKTFAGGAQTFNTINITGGGSGSVIFTGANTFLTLPKISGGTKTLTFPAGVTTTLTGTGGDNFGNGNNLITINSSSAGSAATLSKSVGMVECGFLSLQDSAAIGTFYAGGNSINVSGNSGWKFSNVDIGNSRNAVNRGTIAWLDALDGKDGKFTDRLTKVSYTPSNMTRGANTKSGTAMVFNGSNSKITLGSLGSIYALSFWVNTDTTTEEWIDLNGTQALQITSGTIAATSWTSPTVYVNGVLGATLGAGSWAYVAVTSAVAVTCSAAALGAIGAGFGAFSMTGVRLFDRQLTANEVGKLYNMDRN